MSEQADVLNGFFFEKVILFLGILFVLPCFECKSQSLFFVIKDSSRVN